MPLPATSTAPTPPPGSDGDRIGIGAVAELLAVPRLEVWWRVKTGNFVPPAAVHDGYRWWDRIEVYRWALLHKRPDRVPLRYWPLPDRPATYRGTQLLTGAVAHLWTARTRNVALIWPLP